MPTADVVVKQNDTTPPLKLKQLKNGDGTFINLSGATVKLKVRPAGASTLKIDASSTGSLLSFAGSTSTGYTVTYNWSTGDLDTVDLYEWEVECTLGNGKVTTVPNNKYYTLDVVDDIG